MIQENEINSEDSSVNNNANKTNESADVKADAKADDQTKEKVTIEFPYSEFLRAQVPKVFDVAEKVATDWKHEGDFTDLGIDHPVAGIVASQALQKAKTVEKKLEEKGIFSMAKLGLEIAKEQVKNLRSKIQK